MLTFLHMDLHTADTPTLTLVGGRPMARTVGLAVAPALRERLTRHLEADLGWVVTTPGASDADLCLVDGSVEVPRTPGPRVLLVSDDLDAARAARLAITTGASDVVRWPGDRAELPRLVSALRTPPVEANRAALAVVGASGGVGTSTVALALAGLHAWAGRDTVCVVTGDAAVPDAPTVSDGDLAGPAVWSGGATPVGAERLRVLRRTRHDVDRLPPVAHTGPVVLDLGAGAPDLADVLVLRRDRAGLEAVLRTTAGALVVVDDGPLDEGDLLEAAGARLVVVLPWSARVARAGLARRIPTDLPGSWLAPLRALVEGDPGRHPGSDDVSLT